MKYKGEYSMMLRHSFYLRSSLNLAYDRHQQLEQTIQGLGFSSMPMNDDNFREVQIRAAKEIGGINTRMLLDAPQEPQKYHFGPLQIALCLLGAILDNYEKMVKRNQIFQDDAIDQFRCENEPFVQHLEKVRDSILHQRYDNIDQQIKFVEEYTGSPHMVRLLIEGESIYKDYLRRLWNLLKVGNQYEG